MGVYISTCNPYAPNATLYPCPTTLPSCASTLTELYCLINYAIENDVPKNANICGGKIIDFYHPKDTLNYEYSLTVPNGFQIGCETDNCTVIRRQFLDYQEVFGVLVEYFCPFFTHDLNSKIRIEGVNFYETYVTSLRDEGPDREKTLVNSTGIRNATKSLVALDNLKPLLGPMKIEGASKASTFTQEKAGQKKKKRGGKKTTRQLQEAQILSEVTVAANAAKSNLASRFTIADTNSDGVLDCNEATEVVGPVDCSQYLKYFTGTTSATGVTYSELENIWFGAKRFL